MRTARWLLFLAVASCASVAPVTRLPEMRDFPSQRFVPSKPSEISENVVSLVRTTRPTGPVQCVELKIESTTLDLPNQEPRLMMVWFRVFGVQRAEDFEFFEGDCQHHKPTPLLGRVCNRDDLCTFDEDTVFGFGPSLFPNEP